MGLVALRPVGSGIEPVSPVLAGRFLTTGPEGKPRYANFLLGTLCLQCDDVKTMTDFLYAYGNTTHDLFCISLVITELEHLEKGGKSKKEITHSSTASPKQLLLTFWYSFFQSKCSARIIVLKKLIKDSKKHTFFFPLWPHHVPCGILVNEGLNLGHGSKSPKS